MAFKTFTSTTLSASDMNTYLMKQAVIVCTSGTRPSTPPQGMVIYQTDTDSFRYYNGTAWDVFPGGLVATTTGANTVTSSGVTEVIAAPGTAGLGLSTVSVSSTRSYRIEITGRSSNSTGAQANTIRVRASTGTPTTGSTQVLTGQVCTAGAGGANAFDMAFSGIWTPASTGTWNLAVSTTGGTAGNNGAWGPSNANPAIALYGI